MKTKINKNEIYILLGILGVIIIICINFLQMHYSSDTYVLYNIGYFKYPSEYFLKDGRLISTLFCYLGGILHLPIPTYIIAMDFIGMVFLAISIYIISKIFIDIIKPENKKKEILIYLASFVLILNQYTLEYLLFPESAVMCLGILFTVLAIKSFVSDKKYKYIKTCIFLLLTGLSYQGELNIFPILAILVIMIKQIKEKKEVKEFLKDTFKELIKLAGITIVVLAISFIIVKICGNIFGQDKQSFMIINNARVLRRKINLVLYYSKDVLINCISMFPKYSILVCPILTIILLTLTKAKIQTIVNYIIIVITSIISVVFPLFVVTAAVCARLSIPAMMIFGISLLFLIANLKSDERKYKGKIISIVVISVFVLNSSFIVINSTEHIAANKVDENDGMQIKYLIEKYEQETGIQVTKFGYSYDFEPQQFAVGIKPMQSLTERKLACSWCIVYAMDYYCERNFELVDFDTSILLEDNERGSINKGNQDYKAFSTEQIKFKDDTVYMVVY